MEQEPFLGLRGALSLAPSGRYIAHLVQMQQNVDGALLNAVMGKLFFHHDLLRLCAYRGPSEIQLFIPLVRQGEAVSQIKLAHLSEVEQRSTIRSIATEHYYSLNEYNGFLSHFIYFDRGEQKPGLFLLILHHLLVDGFSINILFQDIQTASLQLSRGESFHLPKKTASLNQFAQRIKRYLYFEFPQELAYWSSLQRKVQPIPVDYPAYKVRNTESSNATTPLPKQCCITLSLNEEETRGLLRAVPATNVPVEDALLAALVQAMADWTGAPGCQIYILNNGRSLFEDIDVTRTIGDIATGFWLYFDAEKTCSPEELLRSIIRQRRQVPHKGMGLRLAAIWDDNEPIWTNIRASQQMQSALAVYSSDNIVFNYQSKAISNPFLGQTLCQAMDQSYQDLVKPPHFPNDPREIQTPCYLGLSALIENEKLFLHWEYHEFLYRPSTIESLAKKHLQILQAIIADCTARATYRRQGRLSRSLTSRIPPGNLS